MDTIGTIMDSQENCGVCGSPLIYGTESSRQPCAYCGNDFDAQIYCP